MGFVFAAGFLLFVGLPLLIIKSMGECLPGGQVEVANCLANKRLELLALLLSIPILAGLVGWVTFRVSTSLG